MLSKLVKMKYIFLGDTESINIEIIVKSHNFLKNKIRYIIICNKSEFYFYLTRIKSKIKVNEILDPIKFNNYKVNYINVFNIEHKYKEKYKNLLNQLDISNNLSKLTGYDLVTMPIDKSIFKKKIKFNGLTEYLGKINACKTAMLMHGEKFSIIPLTTHINLKEVHKYVKNNKLKVYLKGIMDLLSMSKYKLNFKNIIFLCYNPHCSEDNTIGKEDDLISKLIRKYFKRISGPYPADSAFNNIKENTLFISTYHDQSLIPFKILNKKGINYTIGLSYRRFSPAHGTAKDIIFKNKAKNISYIQCMLI
tara:strand:- start:169 stop:1089 length:921 start_codon:yes stop_codon:yes gene_type:complete